jgi:hypothetical protein
MATTKKKVAPRRRRRWLIPKFLLLLSIVALVGFISVLFVMEDELYRVGFFKSGGFSLRLPGLSSTPAVKKPGEKTPSAESAKSASEDSPQGAVPPQARIAGQTPTAPARVGEDLSGDDRKQLDDLLRAKNGNR